jgi:regulator of sigma E protease
MLAALDPLGVAMTVVGLGGLIFFHELGHFIACRLTGTRVEAFSIGFGREIFGWTRGATRYRVGIVPLGGYVKMAAENPGERGTGAPDEFPNKSFPQRLFIMSAGVLFNLVLAFALFAWAFGIGVPLQTREIGQVDPGSAWWQAGVRPGDVITHIDGSEVLDFTHLLTEDLLRVDEPLAITVRRGEERLELLLPPRTGGRGVFPALVAEAFAVAEDSPVGRAGGRAGDRVLEVQGEPVPTPHRIYEILTRLAARAPPEAKELQVTVRVQRRGGPVEDLEVRLPLEERPLIGIIPYEGPRIAAVANGSVAARFLRVGDELVRFNDIAVLDLQLLRDAPRADPLAACIVRRDGAEVAVPAPPGTTVGDLAEGIIGRADPAVARVTPQTDGPAARAGMLPGDVIVTAAGRAISSFTDASKAILAHGVKPIEIGIERGGERRTITVAPVRRPPPPDETGYDFAAVTVMHRERNVILAAAIGWRETKRLIASTVMTVRGLLTRRVSSENIGGPILLVQATYRMFDQGWGLYLHILGLISVNLAILNLLPIPVLDGGQILLLTAEKLRGKPLPERVVGYLQLVGLVLILGLIVLAFKNDITRILQ